MDISNIRQLFPLINGSPNVIYFDNAATTHKPQSVLTAMDQYYKTHNANVGRGNHDLVKLSTQDYENARTKVAQYLHAFNSDEIIFTQGTTDSLNKISQMLADQINVGDIIAVSISDHHSNFLPWQKIANNKDASLAIIGLTNNFELDLDTFFAKYPMDKVKIVAIPAISNVIGKVNPIQQIIERIKKKNPATLVIVDAAQAIGHEYLNVKRIDCDALAFSAHKMYGPQGIGVLYVKRELLKTLTPVVLGGGMVESVSIESYKPTTIPQCFEAGTTNVAGAVGLQAAIEFIESIGIEEIKKHEQELVQYLVEKLKSTVTDGLHIYTDVNKLQNQSGIISFSIDGIDSIDIANFLNDDGIYVRSGEQCAYPLHKAVIKTATVRISFATYNTKAEIEKLIDSLSKAIQMLK